MSLSDNTQVQTISSITQTAATGTVLGRTLVVDPDNGGVFPSYSVTVSYSTSILQVDSNNAPIGIMQSGIDPQTFTLDLPQLYSLYMIPVVALIDGQSVNTTVGELLCDQVDLLIKEQQLGQVFTAMPTSQTISSGDTANLSISLNVLTLSYVNYSIAWLKNGSIIPDATGTTATSVVTATSTFQAQVTTPFGVALSDIATITVETD